MDTPTSTQVPRSQLQKAIHGEGPLKKEEGLSDEDLNLTQDPEGLDDFEQPNDPKWLRDRDQKTLGQPKNLNQPRPPGRRPKTFRRSSLYWGYEKHFDVFDKPDMKCPRACCRYCGTEIRYDSLVTAARHIDKCDKLPEDVVRPKVPKPKERFDRKKSHKFGDETAASIARPVVAGSVVVVIANLPESTENTTFRLATLYYAGIAE
ncbi:hypothetical protein O988_00425 [Pseudogymnoascus sp. VKM F-3808]|nr:hypothetical protein O988_00425 [Pseudogymnoascus sp. VKM F-3808]